MNGLIKLCGLTRDADVHLAVEAGADALGFNFWPKSPRHVTAEQVSDWNTPSDRLRVGIFVNQSIEEIQSIFDTAKLSIVQLHGDENPEFIRKLNRPVWKAVHLDRLPPDLESFPVGAVLIDSGTVNMPGGTGIQVDLQRARTFIEQTRHKVLLAGGLKADTVVEAIHTAIPFGVDVSSGIESAPGIKDPDAIAAFVQQARKAFQSRSTSSSSSP